MATDEDVRELGRAAVREPSPRNLWRLARSLERLGRRRELFSTLAHLARTGDAEARAAVASFHPWTATEGACGRRMALVAGRPRRLVSRTVPLTSGTIEVHAATDRFLYVTSAATDGPDATHDLAAISLEDLSVAWKRTGAGEPSVAVTGDDVVRGTGRELELLDGATGERLERTEPAGYVRALRAGFERALLELAPEPHAESDDEPWVPTRLASVSLARGSFGRELWADARPVGPRFLLAVSDDRFLTTLGTEQLKECRSLEDDALAWRGDFQALAGLRYSFGALRAARGRAFGVLVRDERRSPAFDTAVELDLATGELRRARLPEHVRQEILPPSWLDADAERLVIGRHGDMNPVGISVEWDQVVAVERAALSAATPPPLAGRVLLELHDLQAVALAAEALYVLGKEHRTFVLTAIDASSGASLFEERFEAPFDAARAWVVPVAGAVVVAVAPHEDGPGELFLAKLVTMDGVDLAISSSRNVHSPVDSCTRGVS